MLRPGQTYATFTCCAAARGPRLGEERIDFRVRAQRDSGEAHGHAEHPRRIAVRRSIELEALPKPRRDELRGVIRRIEHERREVVVADARDHIRGAEGLANHLRRGDERAVACFAAMGRH